MFFLAQRNDLPLPPIGRITHTDGIAQPVAVILPEAGTLRNRPGGGIGFMGRCSRFLLDNFNVSPLDSVISVANSSFVDAFFAAQQKRINSSHRFRINFKLYGTALLSKIRHGYKRLPVRFA